MMQVFIIVDEFNNHCFQDQVFESYEDAWDFLYCKFPVIKNSDGTQDDREEELDSYFVVLAY